MLWNKKWNGISTHLQNPCNVGDIVNMLIHVKISSSRLHVQGEHTENLKEHQKNLKYTVGSYLKT